MSRMYVTVSCDTFKDQGRRVLMSFARTPLWKSYEEIRRQNDSIPNCYTKGDAVYSSNKYASAGNKNPYGMIMKYEDVIKEYEQYCENKNLNNE